MGKITGNSFVIAEDSALELLELDSDPEAKVEAVFLEASVVSLLWERLLELRARLLRSFPLSVVLPPASVTPTGLSKSKPNCSKDLLKVAVLG